MNRSQALGAAIALALLTMFAFLVFKTRSVDFEAHGEVVSILRQLKQVDAEWDADVLRSKTGFNANYDPIASPLPLIARLDAALLARTSELLGAEGAAGMTVAKSMGEYRDAMERKTVLIEHFKSQNAILRNSSRYLPLAATELATALPAAVDNASRARIETLLNQIVTGAMTYILTPDAALRATVADRIGTLGGLTGNLPAELHEQASLFAEHAAIILRQQDRGAELLGQLASLHTASKIDALAAAYDVEHERHLLDQQTYRNALIAFSTLLLAALGWLAWRLLSSYRLLRRTNASLKKANNELKESQISLIQSEKMSALGQMVAGIAHEINTPLAYVKGTIDLLGEQIGQVRDLARGSYQLTQLMRDRAEKEVLTRQFLAVEKLARHTEEASVIDEMGELLATGAHGIDKISEIVLNLKNFSRLDRAKVSEFSVQEGLESTLVLAHNLMKERVRVEKEFDAVPAITCSPSQINQVFLNILSNAVQAMPEDRQGVVTLRTSRLDEEHICVEIQDDGSGIPADVLPKIFDPFYTTKEIGKGTGMGLSISYKIIEEHGGRIEVSTEPGVGTVFSIVLPIKPPKADESEIFEAETLLLAA